MSEIVLECQDVGHWFGTKRVLNKVNLKISAGQIVAVVGPSGCGKSTLLRAILGTHPPKQGRIIANGHPVTRPGRDVGIVYQHYSLYDFLTSRDNVAFGPMLDQTTLWFRLFRPLAWRRLRAEHRRQAIDVLRQVELAESAHLYPTEMSGMSESDPLDSPYPCSRCAWRSASSSEEEAEWIPRSSCSVSSSYRYTRRLRCYINEHI